MSPPPNILLIMTDQQRHDQLGFSSGGHFETPTLDALASRGVVFDAAYSASTTCVPARVALLSGVHHHRAPLGRKLALKPGSWTLARSLSSAGYQTQYIGKMHAHPLRARHGFAHLRLCEHLVDHAGYKPTDMDDYRTWLVWQGRADWRTTHLFGDDLEEEARAYRQALQTDPFPLSDAYHPTGWIARETVEALGRRDRSRPFFCVVSFPHPHAPYDPPEPYCSMYRPSESTLARVSESKSLPDPFRVLRQVTTSRFRPSRIEDVGEVAARRVLASIRALIRQIDDAVARIVEAIDLRDTLLFFTSDHGDYSSHRGLLGKIPWIPFDDLARVPLFAVGAGIAGGRRVSTVVQNFDFVATALSRAGCPAPPDLDSIDLSTCLDGGAPSDPSRVVFSAASMGWPMARRGSLKYIRSGRTGDEVLFDLSKDPGEVANRAGEPAYGAKLQELRRALDEHLASPKANLAEVP